MGKYCKLPFIKEYYFAFSSATFEDISLFRCLGFPGGAVVKNPSVNGGDERYAGLPVAGNSNPLQYSWLENSMDRGAWQATGYGVTKSWI